MNYSVLIKELREMFPSNAIAPPFGYADNSWWVWDQGSRRGRDEVISYLETLWGVKETPKEDLSHVYSTENRISADEYGRARSSDPAAGPNVS